MGQIVQLKEKKKNFASYVTELQKLCENDLFLINSLILEKLEIFLVFYGDS